MGLTGRDYDIWRRLSCHRVPDCWKQIIGNSNVHLNERKAKRKEDYTGKTFKIQAIIFKCFLGPYRIIRFPSLKTFTLYSQTYRLFKHLIVGLFEIFIAAFIEQVRRYVVVFLWWPRWIFFFFFDGLFSYSLNFIHLDIVAKGFRINA